MKRKRISFVILGAIFCHGQVYGIPATSSPAAHIVRIDPTKSWGKWDGWGVTLCWWAHVFGDRDDLADAAFTMKDVSIGQQVVPGLGLTIVRYNAGACSTQPVDGHHMMVSKIIMPYRQMPCFWVDDRSDDPRSASWDWSVDANQRAMLTKARDRGVDHFELFANSPPWWMCANDDPSGGADPKTDNLRPERYRDFAAYLAVVAAEAQRSWGIKFESVEAFNEPSSDFWSANCKQEGCHFSEAAQAAILPLLRQAMDQRGLGGMKIAASDENTYDEALATWHELGEQGRSLVGRVNVHGYQSRGGNRAGLFAAVHGTPLWNSEYGDGRSDGLLMARNLNLDLHELHPTGWCYWQLLDGGGWGLINANPARGRVFGPAGKYYVLAQYTRHIRPGMMILQTDDPMAVAGYDVQGKRLAVVLLNLASEVENATLDLSRFSIVGDGLVRAFLTEPRGGARYARQTDLRIADQKVRVAVPADAVETFEVGGIAR